MASSDTGGVTPMGIAGRTVRERERLAGMTTEERAWRKQWLKDQHLTAREPVHVPEYWKERTNAIRRMYQAPLNILEGALRPILGQQRAFSTRFWTGKAFMVMGTIWAGAYYFKYNQNDWTRKGGWRVIKSRTSCPPGAEGFPRMSDRTKPSDYAARGFNQAAI